MTVRLASTRMAQASSSTTATLDPAPPCARQRENAQRRGDRDEIPHAPPVVDTRALDPVHPGAATRMR